MTAVFITRKDSYFIVEPGLATHSGNGAPSFDGNDGDRSVSNDGVGGNLYEWFPEDHPNPGDPAGWFDHGPYSGMEVSWFEGVPTPEVLGYDPNPNVCYEWVEENNSGWLVVSADAHPDELLQTPWQTPRVIMGDPMNVDAWNGDELAPNARNRIADDLDLSVPQARGMTAAEACKGYATIAEAGDEGRYSGQPIRDGNGGQVIVRQILFLDSTRDLLNRPVPQGRSK